MRNSSELLRSYFDRKKNSRSGFSMRLFASSLGVAPSFASDILNGKKTIPLSRLSELKKVLELDELSLNLIKRALVEEALMEQGLDVEQTFKKQASRNYALSTKPNFSILTPWYNVAIMDLTTCDNFKKDPSWIAKRLGISKYQVEQSLNLLLSRGLLKESKGTYKKVNNKIRLALSESHEEIRKYHGQMIDKAKVELFSKTSKEAFELREIAGITIATNPKNISRARQRLVEAIHEVADILSEGECTDLYQINTQLFTLLSSQE
jgi:uncharacterized protein (TIGR02147 family)